MAPKPAQDKVQQLRRAGRTEAEIRARLKEEGYKPGRTSQLLTLTRVEDRREAERGSVSFFGFVCKRSKQNRQNQYKDLENDRYEIYISRCR